MYTDLQSAASPLRHVASFLMLLQVAPQSTVVDAPSGCPQSTVVDAPSGCPQATVADAPSVAHAATGFFDTPSGCPLATRAGTLTGFSQEVW